METCSALVSFQFSIAVFIPYICVDISHIKINSFGCYLVVVCNEHYKTQPAKPSNEIKYF